ncbi:stress-responsive transcription factor hsf1 [Tulasnella sp. 419]|nr:stress-responsive transcription factor hsf1 [Tulasnella sp. 419]
MTDPKKMEFAHPSFLRDCPQLLNQISDCLGIAKDVVTPPSAGASEKVEVRQIQEDTSPLSSIIGIPTSSSAHSHSRNSRDGSESSSPPSRHLFPNFVCDLFEIVNNSVNSETIGWSEDGSAILLGNLFKFTQEVLPFYFGYFQISTFLRQLRIHNFRSLKGFRVSAPGQGIETWQFSHPCFRRGHPDLLVNIDASLMATTSDESDYSEVAFVHSSSEIEQLESIEQPSSTPKLLHQKNKQGSLGLHRASHGPSTTLLKESGSPSGLSESPLQSENFVTILHRLLQKNVACDQLKWCSNGKSFVIRLSSKFKNTILIPHFPDMDAVGFLRQLRALRFTISNQKTIQETGNTTRVATYTHAKFRHDQPELLSRVREKPAISVRSRTRPDTANTNTVAHGKVINEKRSRRKME